MKKLLSVFLILCLMLSMVTIAFAGETTTTQVDNDGTITITDHSNDALLEDINNMADSKAKEKILNLFYTPAYVEFSEDDSILTDNSNSNSKIEKLLKLSGTELDNAISDIVKETIKKNKNRKDLVWHNNFINQYAKTYDPNSVLQLEKISSSNASRIKNIKDAADKKMESLRSAIISSSTTAAISSAITSSSTTSSTKTVSTTQKYYNSSGTALCGLKLSVQFSYNGTYIWGLYPTTTKYLSSGFSFYKYETDRQSIDDDNRAGSVEKDGVFMGPVITVLVDVYVYVFGSGNYDAGGDCTRY